ncbi:hypothetical protein SAMN05216302_101459 [Nitrosomonas aestuarii]|uniref:SMODS and SLOG-associating 2TM effector domain-containing protein n=1 Tax=Nitrosomonas aestuarii TaxID=52441 RepID=A0A1I4C445_9PROT|nr:hypothetical protein [Nitrosomonas aestuarii]SFK75089.1 hypothetical protein SAMN05216302_101459 [Nitrosomonas aestuarii]
MKEKEQLIGEIRYAIRLTQRTARLYRRVQTFGIFMSIIGGSAAIASIADNMPTWIAAIGAIFLTFAGAMLIAVRPADKAAQNEADARRYQLLMSHSTGMDAEQLYHALEETRIGDTSEIETLRNIAYNDVVIEINRPDALMELSMLQKILRTLA